MKKVPGIGNVRRWNLLKWRTMCENQFHFNPSIPIPLADVHAVKLKYAQARQSAHIELRGGAGNLSAFETETLRVVTSMESKLPQLTRAYAQAVADHRECL